MRYISWFTRHGCDISGSKNRRVESGYRWQANQIRAHCTWYRLQLWSENIAHIVTGTRATSGHDNHRYSRAFAHHESIGTAALCARESSVPRMPLVDANKCDSNRFERESNVHATLLRKNLSYKRSPRSISDASLTEELQNLNNPFAIRVSMSKVEIWKETAFLFC